MKQRKDFNLILGCIFVGMVLLPVLIGMFKLPYDSSAMDAAAKFQAPSLSHIFGTDNYGRDIYSRVMEGARMTFLVGLLTVLIGGGIGIFVGAVTGYFGGMADEILMRINDGIAAFPSVLLALVLVSVFGAGQYMIVIVLGIVFIPSFARIARSEFIAQKDMDYVKNAKLMGAGSMRIMFVHILPNTKSILLSAITVGFNNAVLAEAGLSYLSIGAQPTDASLGYMLSKAQSFLTVAPWYALAPGLVIIITVLGFSLISEHFSSEGNIHPAAVRTGKKIKKPLAAKNNLNADDNKVEAEKDKIHADTCIPQNNILLSVRDMTIGFNEAGAWDYVTHNVSFDVKKGEILGIVGESGSGKSMTALAIMGLLKKHAKVTGGNILFNGLDLAGLDDKEYRKLRGYNISMIFQEPMTTLNPVMTIGHQIEEMLLIHGLPYATDEDRDEKENVNGPKKRHDTYKKYSVEAMKEAGLTGVEELYDKYPHQLSGGMRQRVIIAMAMVCNPQLLIADEPTTALDVTIQAKILGLLKRLNENKGTTMIFISHDLKVIRKMCSRVAVMYKGEIVEQGKVEDIFDNPVNPYTKALIKASLGVLKTKEETFERKHEHIMDIKNLSVFYDEKGNGILAKSKMHIAVNDVSLHVNSGEILGVVGESGCGKSSMAKAIVGLQRYMSGTINLSATRPQMVFQDPYGSLNPSKTVEWLLEEPLKLNTDMSGEERKAHVDEILAKVGLTNDYKKRYPSALSGGQRQRVAIAMALILNQKLIVLDEPVSALDVTVQDQILRLLLKLRDEENLSYLFISHDMNVIRRMCDYVCVMYHGDIVETASTEKIFENPQHAYTKQLLEAALK